MIKKKNTDSIRQFEIIVSRIGVWKIFVAIEKANTLYIYWFPGCLVSHSMIFSMKWEENFGQIHCVVVIFVRYSYLINIIICFEI